MSGGRYTRAAAAQGMSLADVLALLLIGRIWERYYAAIGWWGVALVVLLVVMPFALAAWLSYHCTAWNTTREGRCDRPRPQPFRRCEEREHSHSKQWVTAHEVGCVTAALMGCLGIVFLLGGLG